jgi:hypothetical protein
MRIYLQRRSGFNRSRFTCHHFLDSYSIYNTSDEAPLPLTANRDLTQRVARLQQCWCRLVLTALTFPR